MNSAQAVTRRRLVMTRGVNDRVADNAAFAKFVLRSTKRHLSGDWGGVCEEDKAANDFAVKNGERRLSAYENDGQPKIWIITEADGSATTILFPDEY